MQKVSWGDVPGQIRLYEARVQRVRQDAVARRVALVQLSSENDVRELRIACQKREKGGGGRGWRPAGGRE